MNLLHDYQSQAVQKITDFFDSDEVKAKLYIARGLGSNTIAAAAIETILQNHPYCTILVLYRSRSECDQFYEFLTSKAIECNTAYKDRNAPYIVQICTIYDLENKTVLIDDFDLVMDFDSKALQAADVNAAIHQKQAPTRFVGFFGVPETESEWFYDAPCIFSYGYTEAIRDGYDSVISERGIEQFLYFQIFSKNGFQMAFEQQKLLVTSNIRPDMVLEKDGQYYLAEIKYYRSFQYSSDNLNHAVKQMCYYKSVVEENSSTRFKEYIVIMLCVVDDSEIQNIYDQYGVTVWDIRNILYFCQDYPEAKDAFETIIPFPAAQIEPCPPLEIKDYKSAGKAPMQFECIEDKLIFALNQCQCGKNNHADKKYEAICNRIIEHLFTAEFYKKDKQRSTSDAMFRMDLICSLKGTEEFWRFLMHYFHTKFVVFEYKNYKEPISQNLIYITEKYLYPAVLRNVAFIISRNGFHPHAKIAAKGCLIESGKLIVSLDDNDLCEMLLKKKNGEEPSDYLLNKVEEMLMDVSK